MKHYVELDTQKYYRAKTKADAIMLRRHKAGQAIKTFFLASIIITGFTIACFALLQSPDTVLGAVETLKTQGLWPR